MGEVSYQGDERIIWNKTIKSELDKVMEGTLSLTVPGQGILHSLVIYVWSKHWSIIIDVIIIVGNIISYCNYSRYTRTLYLL